jgi:hypothetical protein
VLVNQYYNPFDTSQHCMDQVGLDAAKEKSLTGLLQALNGVPAKGAQAAGLPAVRPDFTGHQLCDAEPYVQGLKATAPFHPTAAGGLAIAIADEAALRGRPAEPSPAASLTSGPAASSPAPSGSGQS